MSRVGSKRKVDTSEIVSSSTEVPENDEFLSSIDDEIESAIAKVKEGSHVELSKRSDALKRAKENKMATADRHRKMQIKNINLLYEYELEDANALYNKAYAEVQEQMVAELQLERVRLRTAYKQQLAAAALAGTTVGANGKAGVDSSEANTNTASSSGAAGRSTRSTVPALDMDALNGSSGGNGSEYVSADSKLEMLFNSSKAVAGAASSALLSGLPMGGARSSRRRPGSSAAGGGAPLEQVLPESSMRSDLLEIVRDLQAQAERFERTKPKALDQVVALSADLSELAVGSEVFAVGDTVVVFSALSQEHLSGVLTSLSEREAVVRIGTGARFSFLISQVRSGRVTLSGDAEAAQNVAMMRAALQSSSSNSNTSTYYQQQQQQQSLHSNGVEGVQVMT